jgi:aspartyl-tRNA(Asn)/glutamyl-tRNA(Gln) amidotransferase subunit B
VLATIIERGGGSASAIAAELGYEALDTSELEAMVEAALAAQPDAWQKYLAGEGKALGAIVGHVMRASKGQADGKLVNQVLNRRAAEARS